jgi:hypothetical protein
METTTTVEIDKETHKLVRQYCVINGVKIKNFISDLADEELEEFKKMIKNVRKTKL